jgi:hypothetical protein
MTQGPSERGTTGGQALPTGRRSAGRGQQRRTRTIVRTAAAVAVVAAAVFVWGGYDRGWRWTGLSSAVTLWDWLQALALPVVVGVTPLLLRHRQHLTGGHRVAVVTTLVTFALLVSAGYLVPLRWTGFTGNTLWDWLELALLPLVLATASLWAGRDDIGGRHLLVGSVLAGGFVLLVACGYLVPWTWTGFRGNTAWDWIKLLLVPVLVPTVLLPAVIDRVTHRLVPSEVSATG